MLALGLADRLPHFRVDLSASTRRSISCSRRCAKTYPSLDVPFHARWRHFVVGGIDRWAAIAERDAWRDRAARARAEFDLAIISVLLDAGAGPTWRYRDGVTGAEIGRSEGLALASLDMFAAGVFSAGRTSRCAPMRRRWRGSRLLICATVFRSPMTIRSSGLRAASRCCAGSASRSRRHRASLLHRHAAPRRTVRSPGGEADGGAIAAPAILSELLHRAWTDLAVAHHARGDDSLGDCWRHPTLATDDATSDLVPLHKLSQWLTYSLIEPLSAPGLR